jgi:hypothetical protein
LAKSEWRVTRKEDEVRVDVTDSASFQQADADGIVADVTRELDHDGVSAVRFGGPVLETRNVSERMGRLISRLANVVEGRGLRFFLGPL